MYNRYVRDADGNYRRQIMHKAPQEAPQETPQHAMHPPAEVKKAPLQKAPPTVFTAPDPGDLLVLLVLLLILTESDDGDKMALLITIAAFIMIR